MIINTVEVEKRLLQRLFDSFEELKKATIHPELKPLHDMAILFLGYKDLSMKEILNKEAEIIAFSIIPSSINVVYFDIHVKQTYADCTIFIRTLFNYEKVLEFFLAYPSLNSIIPSEN